MQDNTTPLKTITNMNKTAEEKCCAGCKAFTGGEIKHHKDCYYYPDSLSKTFDDMEKYLESYRSLPSGVTEQQLEDFDVLPDEKKQEYLDDACSLLSDDLMFCTRVWSAWGVGTMTENDFVTASSEDDFVYQIAKKLHDNFISGFKASCPVSEKEPDIHDKNGVKVKDGDMLIYIGTNMSSLEVRELKGRLIGIGPFNVHYLSDYISADDFQSIEIDTPPTTK